MNQPDHESEPSAPRSRLGASNTRRTFMKRAIGGLAIAIPAYRVLSSTAPASAATPGSCTGSCPDPCATVRLKLLGSHCAGNALSTSCKGPAVSACILTYDKISTTTGQVCGTFIEQSGYCNP